MDDAPAAPPAGKRDVERLFRKAGVQLGIVELAPPAIESRFEPLLGSVVRGTCGLPLFGRALRRKKSGKLARFSEIASLDVLQRRRVVCLAELAQRARHQAFELLHAFPPGGDVSAPGWLLPGSRFLRRPPCPSRPGPRAPCGRSRCW